MRRSGIVAVAKTRLGSGCVKGINSTWHSQLGLLIVGYLLSSGGEAAALGTGQRNLSAALLVGASFGDAETLVMTLVACLVLMVALLLVGGEVGKRSPVQKSAAKTEGEHNQAQAG